MKGTGKKINNTVKDWKHGLIMQVIEEIMLKEESMVTVNLHGQMEALTLVNFKKII